MRVACIYIVITKQGYETRQKAKRIEKKKRKKKENLSSMSLKYAYIQTIVKA